MNRFVGLLVAFCLVPACDKEKPEPPVEVQKVEQTQDILVDADDPVQCAPCHGNVVAEWRESMHSQAHHDKDPIYGAMLAYRMTKEGDDLPQRCGTCHTPRNPAEPNSPESKQGVSCAACHNISAVHIEGGQRGSSALVRAENGMFRGGRDIPEGASPVHKTGPALEALKDGKTLCLACHGEMKNAASVPTCTTGLELGGAEGTCVSCHMPEVAGPHGAVSTRETHRSHAFLGPHRAWLQDDKSILEDAIDLKTSWSGQDLRVTLSNKTGHGFPTGFPGRTAVLFARGLDEVGDEVWRNIDEDPMAEHPEAVLNKVYHDSEGAPVLPPYGEKLARDSRLKPGEERVIEFQVPEAVTQIELQMKFWLIPGKAAETLGIGDHHVATPVVFKEVQISK